MDDLQLSDTGTSGIGIDIAGGALELEGGWMTLELVASIKIPESLCAMTARLSTTNAWRLASSAAC